MKERRKSPRPSLEDDGPDLPEPTVRARERPDFDDERGERVVPLSNVGGAAPTRLGGDSGGDLPGPEDDLTNLIEPEPPQSPEMNAMHVRRGGGPHGPRRKP
ncbi:hypothetical protein [Anaeromyxobacter diazotrophicus]|uniref:Uncharacterized protein n=1 Tax=Anaeromyxobacter diazotrophicus TaxID=2590199 RepID=A0A7I9VRA7_9BACT|nr:hypothetical protein [Anaeromyxobacter diazotrophicus]GEJ58640.1 hypothetical protein AMYX_33810 [Anaeromyxobacter diazotrophicus]